MAPFPSWLWILFTVTAAGAQTFRNAMQRHLIETIGAAGATHVRFLYGLPFALVFLAFAVAMTGLRPNPLTFAALEWIGLGAVAQILATGLMLEAMREHSFVATIAYTKTEPVQIALFALIFLGNPITGSLLLAIFLTTAGVMIMSWPKKRAATAATGKRANWRPAILGLCAASCFAASAIGFREGILALHGPSFIIAASTALVVGLLIQSALILCALAVFDRNLLKAIAFAWRPSLFAGFMGAFASQFWFLAFAIETAARVRTLALVEVLFAQIAARRMFNQGASSRDIAGIAMIVAGVIILLNA